MHLFLAECMEPEIEAGAVYRGLRRSADEQQATGQRPECDRARVLASQVATVSTVSEHVYDTFQLNLKPETNGSDEEEIFGPACFVDAPNTESTPTASSRSLHFSCHFLVFDLVVPLRGQISSFSSRRAVSNHGPISEHTWVRAEWPPHSNTSDELA